MDVLTDRSHLTGADGSRGPSSPPRDQSVDEAALEAVSTSALLPGEDASSPYLRDAEHWMAVYSELYSFIVRIVERFRSTMPDLGDVAQEYLQSHDIVIHQKQMQRFAERLAFWTRRAADLQAAQNRLTQTEVAPAE